MTREVYLRFDCRADVRNVDFEHHLRRAEHFGGPHHAATRRVLRSRLAGKETPFEAGAGSGPGSGFCRGAFPPPTVDAALGLAG